MERLDQAPKVDLEVVVKGILKTFWSFWKRLPTSDAKRWFPLTSKQVRALDDLAQNEDLQLCISVDWKR